ncbi:MAG: hypothetical protein FWD25_07475 [Clostridia bacterium]|nr:hypothetical protein [Clostridia bacterium]
MKVRVYDKASRTYFKSNVYAIINHGWFTKYLALLPTTDGGRFKMYDYLDKTKKGPHYPVNVNIILPEYPNEWVQYKAEELTNLKEALKRAVKSRRVRIEPLDYFVGYDFIWANKEALAALIKGDTIPANQFDLPPVKNSEPQEWISVDTQAGIEHLMKTYQGFHDSVIVSLGYISGTDIHEGGSVGACDSIRKVSITFDSCWSKPIQLVFEGVTALNLRPAQDNYGSDIFSATIIIKDEVVYFCNEDIKDIASFPDGSTWISAFSLKWKYV